MAALLLHVLDRPDTAGRYNAVAPGIVCNRDFTLAVAKRLRRPVVWSLPAWLVRALVGAERASILLEGQNVKPKRTLASGFRFAYPDIDSALDDLVKIHF
jgi:NAD dependent epimerase/dehydratase family enzyme